MGGGYGNYITIKHANGVYSRYAHMDSVYVKMGQKVYAGNQIGTIGTSGRVGAPHLHFEIRQNTKGMAAGGWNPLDKSRFTYVLPGEKNVQKVGWVKSNNKWYFYKNGIAQKGWLKEDNKWYYLNTSGVMQTGWKKIDNNWYYFNTSGVMQTGWKKIDNNWYYLYDSGAMATGWKKIDNNWYYLYDSGAMATGWEKIDNKWYYLNTSGVMQTGWKKIDNNWYYLYDSGAMATGWEKIDNKWYYLNTSGVMQTGWKKINNEWYYLYNSGAMASNTIIDNWKIDSNGVASKIESDANGWIQVGKNWTYYLNGVAQTGWINSSNNWYFLDQNSMMQTGWQKIDNRYYYLNMSGVMQTGWQKIDNKWYYLNTSGVMQTGWQKIDNKWYYLYNSGAMASNVIINNWKIDSNGVASKIESDANGWIQIGKDWTYYLNGVAQTGWINSSNNWYFLDDNGVMQTGWQIINNQRYYFYDSGKMASNAVIDNWKIDENGIAMKQEIKLNGWYFEEGNWYYYINNVKQKGWLTIGNKKYYLNSNGQMQSDCWAKINNKQYYFNANGEMVKGWHKWRNQWYYLNSLGEMLTQGVIDNWIITSSGMAYRSNQMNPDYVVNKSIDRLVKLDYIYNPDLNKNNSKYKTISGTPGYEEALTEAVVVHVLTNNSKEFNVYLDGNVAHIFYK